MSDRHGVGPIRILEESEFADSIRSWSYLTTISDFSGNKNVPESIILLSFYHEYGEAHCLVQWKFAIQVVKFVKIDLNWMTFTIPDFEFSAQL